MTDQERIAALETLVRELERRIAALEKFVEPEHLLNVMMHTPIRLEVTAPDTFRVVPDKQPPPSSLK